MNHNFGHARKSISQSRLNSFDETAAERYMQSTDRQYQIDRLESRRICLERQTDMIKPIKNTYSSARRQHQRSSNALRMSTNHLIQREFLISSVL